MIDKVGYKLITFSRVEHVLRKSQPSNPNIIFKNKLNFVGKNHKYVTMNMLRMEINRKLFEIVLFSTRGLKSCIQKYVKCV